MCACRLSARSVVRGAWVAPPPVRQGSSSGDRAGVPLCAGDPADSSREPQQRLFAAAVASQNVSPSPRRHAVWLCVGLRSSFSVREHKGGGAPGRSPGRRDHRRPPPSVQGRWQQFIDSPYVRTSSVRTRIRCLVQRTNVRTYVVRTWADIYILILERMSYIYIY